MPDAMNPPQVETFNLPAMSASYTTTPVENYDFSRILRGFT